ncbi:DUF1127 domain-containing protein [Rhodobacteraceae bacterium CCMM004]|nr:DUF1127 domain-containing protein [Rhodobacteraceae bacterium CCMM004]
MAYASTTHRTDRGTRSRIANSFSQIGESWARYRLYRRTLSEMQDLSNRELADLGLNRSNLRSIAYHAAYGDV